MAITEAMVDAALRKAIEAGLFPRRGSPEELAIGREIMRSILHAASEVAEHDFTGDQTWQLFSQLPSSEGYRQLSQAACAEHFEI